MVPLVAESHLSVPEFPLHHYSINHCVISTIHSWALGSIILQQLSI